MSARTLLMCREEDEELRSRKKAEDVHQVRRHLTFLKAACVSPTCPQFSNGIYKAALRNLRAKQNRPALNVVFDSH